MRATIDLDDPTELEVIRAWNRMESFGDGRVHGRVSSSGKGVHLKVHGCEEDEVEHLRRVCGDDQKRRDFDRDSDLKPKQIMFSEKPTGAGASDWTRDMDRVLAVYRRRCPVETRYPGLSSGL